MAEEPASEKKFVGRGGPGRGGGRRPGAANVKSRAIAERLLAKTAITPLEVMVEAMLHAYREHGAMAAFPYAKDAAPYMHAKIAAVELTGKDGAPMQMQQVTAAELAEAVRRVREEF